MLWFSGWLSNWGLDSSGSHKKNHKEDTKSKKDIELFNHHHHLTITKPAYCTTKPCLKLILHPQPFCKPGKLHDYSGEEKGSIRSPSRQGIWRKLKIHCIEIVQGIIARILNPCPPDSLGKGTGFGVSLVRSSISWSEESSLFHVDGCVHLPVQLSHYFLHTYLGFIFRSCSSFWFSAWLLCAISTWL